MIRTRIFISFVLMLMLALAASASDKGLTLRPVFKAGEQSRYVINASVDTKVEPAGVDGLASDAHKELSATILLTTTSVGEKGEVTFEAVIEKISGSTLAGGVNSPVNAAAIVGVKIQYTLNPAGQLLKCSVPLAAADAGLADLLFSLTGWFPSGMVVVGEGWKASGQGPVYADRLSEIAKASSTTYKLSAVERNIALIDGAITLEQSGAARLSTGAGKLNVNVLAAGKGAARFEYDLERGRILNGASEATIEGRLAHILPTKEGEKMNPREGKLVESSKFSIKLVD
jgi:hypothetical protein